MSKKLRRQPINIAPEISGWIDEDQNPHVFDSRENNVLDPRNVEHKIIIYERQVRDWFLNKAKRLTKTNNNGFIVLMICLSYLEGIEQYRRGLSSNGQSRQYFIDSVNRIYPNQFTEAKLGELYSEARCGLFHNGMIRGKIIISYTYDTAIEFLDDRNIKINPKTFLADITSDFQFYLAEIRSPGELRKRFNSMFNNLW